MEWVKSIKRPIRVLMGCGDACFVEMMGTVIQEATGGRPVHVTECSHLDVLWNATERKTFDLIIVVINNLILPAEMGERSMNEKLLWAAEGVRLLKSRHRCPVIVLSGYLHLLLEVIHEAHDIDVYLPIPCDLDELRISIQDLLAE
ncbi:MAG: hypothetical protein AB1705_08105 [Verrucomicrobiota bacterium]